MELLIDGLKFLFQDSQAFLLIVFGVFFGLIFGSMPGLTAALGVTLLVPFTFTLTAEQGIGMLIGIYVGGICGGLYAATLLNIPGTPANIVTMFDGYPMAMQGRGSEALTLGVFSSLIGGLVGMGVLTLLAPFLAKVALMFGNWQTFALGILGLSVVVSLCSTDLIKGLISAVIGILLAMVGMDPVLGVSRFSFGTWQLDGGLETLAALMGFFAIAEILRQLDLLGVEGNRLTIKSKVRYFPPLKEIIGNIKVMLGSSFIGTFFGILPGVGQSAGSLFAYNQFKNYSRTPEKWGKGHPGGIAASEAANNAVNGGALIPLMTLGIPGDLVTAVLIGGLVIHGLQPGPLLFRDNPEVVGAIFSSFLIANIIMFIMAILLARFFVRLLDVKFHVILPVILTMCVLGSFALNNRVFDVWVLLVIGVLGYFLLRSEYPLPPIILGFIIGPIIEDNLRTGLIQTRGDLIVGISNPLTIGLLVASAITIVYPLILSKKNENQKQKRKI